VPEVAPKSLGHRLRVLENQAKLAAKSAAPSEPQNPQLTMPLLVEVRANAETKQRVRRPRAKPRTHQPDFGEL